MPSTVNQLLNSDNLKLKGQVKWGHTVNSNSKGVYIVSLSSDPNKNLGNLNLAPISKNMINFWLNKVKTFELDLKINPDCEVVMERIANFWLPDENILYIGKATNLKTRINSYYYTELGEKRPHAGGHWLKVLSNLNELHVYYAECELEPKLSEDKMLETFKQNVSLTTKSILFDKERTFPFANLEFPPRNIKKHGIGKCKLK